MADLAAHKRCGICDQWVPRDAPFETVAVGDARVSAAAREAIDAAVFAGCRPPRTISVCAHHLTCEAAINGVACDKPSRHYLVIDGGPDNRYSTALCADHFAYAQEHRETIVGAIGRKRRG